MTTLALNFYAVKQSYALEMPGQTRLVPTKSAVCGLALSALGIPPQNRAGNTQFNLNRVHVRVDRPGQVQKDFCVAAGFCGAHTRPTSKTNIVYEPTYLHDAQFTVLIEGQDGNYLRALADAIPRPCRAIYLGRKFCHPLGDVLVAVADSPADDLALNLPARPITDAPPLTQVDYYQEVERDGQVIKDVALSFDPHVHGYRQVIVRRLSLAPDNKPDPPKKRDTTWATKQERFRFDNFACVYCKRKSLLEYAHLTYIRQGYEELGDAITLCKICHEAATALNPYLGHFDPRTLTNAARDSYESIRQAILTTFNNTLNSRQQRTSHNTWTPLPY